MSKTIIWQYKHFNDLTVNELYCILQLRSEIFVVEQRCLFQDMDDLDKNGYHVTAWRDGELIAYARLLAPGQPYPEQSIGRVVVRVTARSAGLGKELMEYCAERSYKLFGRNSIKIGAQHYLKKFYESQGYEQCSSIYDDAGIDHIQMLKQPN